jgi:DNA polymerase III delta prime subunit
VAAKSNKHVWEYLTYYLGLTHAPCFAVLISGPWGVGKTYLLKAFLKDKFGQDTAKYVYVSLYGLSSIEEIDDALFNAAFPALTGTAAKVAGRVAKAGLKFLKVDPGDWNIKEFINKFDAKVYVFDDLERCEAPIHKVLGYINQFVEHGGAKVIIVANEKEIGANEDYGRRREKLIGKTLQVSSVFEEAFPYFTSNIDHPGARAFIQASATDVATIYAQSGLENFRILQQTMWDFERFYAALSPKHMADQQAMATLLHLLFVLSFEFKAARITEDDIIAGRGTTAGLLAMFFADKQSPIARAASRYPIVNIYDNVLSNELLIDYLVRGTVDEDAVRGELNASRFFVSVADEQSWRTICLSGERSDAEFDAAVSRMEEQFRQRAFTKDGEILHVLGLRLFLSDLGILQFSRADVVTQGKQYIDDVYAARKLEKPSFDEGNEGRYQEWDGLGIHEQHTDDYNVLFRHLVSATRRSVEDTYPERAKQLLSDMKSDTSSFYRQVALNLADGSGYIRVPVLAKMPVDDFVDTFLSLHPTDQSLAMWALRSRYEDGRLEQNLDAERPWIMAVHDTLGKRSPQLSAISRHRLGKLLDWYTQIVKPEADSEKSKELR